MLTLACQAGASPLFEGSEVLAIDLSGPIDTLIETKAKRDELVFSLRVDDVEHPIKVRVRGNSRLRVCDFPPLRLNFSKEHSDLTVFAGQDKLKLVTHCKDDAAADANLLEEYAAYKIFNLITDVGYRVRLVKVTYHDTDEHSKEKTFVRSGFLIESASELAARVGGDIVDVAGISLGSLNTQQAAAVFVFQYLIGNTDWSLVAAETEQTCCHNGDLFDIGSDRYYVPYDFDLSGLVNASYARPDPALRISRVTKRLYRGYCISTDAVENALKDITARRASILDVIHQLPGLPQKEVDAKTRYLEQFFARASNEQKTVRLFERKCL